MLFDEPGRFGAIYIAAASGIPGEQMIARKLPQGRAKPGSDGDRKSLFRTVDDGVGQDSTHRAAQQRLSASSMDLRRVRQRGGELHHLVIEKRNTQFESVGHGHFVGLDEEVVGQPHLGVDIKHPVQWRGLLDRFEICSEDGPQLPSGLLHAIRTDQAQFAFVGKASGHAPVAGFQRLAAHSDIMPELFRWREMGGPRGQSAQRAGAGVDTVEGQHAAIDPITGENLVGAFTREDHRNVFTR